MPEEFVPLALLLRERREYRSSQPSAAAQASAPASSGDPASVRCVAPLAESVARELTAMRLAALESFERLRDRLLVALANDVLARELELRPADVQRLCDRMLADLAGEDAVRLVLCASDAAAIRSGLPVRIDPSLRQGDVIVELRDGEIDARFDLRASAALELRESGALELRESGALELTESGALEP